MLIFKVVLRLKKKKKYNSQTAHRTDPLFFFQSQEKHSFAQISAHPLVKQHYNSLVANWSELELISNRELRMCKEIPAASALVEASLLHPYH